MDSLSAAIRRQLAQAGFSLSSFLTSLLVHGTPADPLLHDLYTNFGAVTSAFIKHAPQDILWRTTLNLPSIITNLYLSEIEILVHPISGFHFNATRARAGNIEGFELSEMGERMQQLAPHLWSFLGAVLRSEENLGEREQMVKPTGDEDFRIGDGDVETIGEAVDGEDGLSGKQRRGLAIEYYLNILRHV
jgi:hypothetical protein